LAIFEEDGGADDDCYYSIVIIIIYTTTTTTTITIIISIIIIIIIIIIKSYINLNSIITLVKKSVLYLHDMTIPVPAGGMATRFELDRLGIESRWA
jgi:hypothetical protein